MPSGRRTAASNFYLVAWVVGDKSTSPVVAVRVFHFQLEPVHRGPTAPASSSLQFPTTTSRNYEQFWCIWTALLGRGDGCRGTRRGALGQAQAPLVDGDGVVQGLNVVRGVQQLPCASSTSSAPLHMGHGRSGNRSVVGASRTTRER